MTRRHYTIAGFLLVAALAVTVADLYACGPFIVFRAYLAPDFWRPARRYSNDLAVGLPADTATRGPYAGMSPKGGSPTLQEVRDAYRDLFPGSDPIDAPFTYPLHWTDETLSHLRVLASAAKAASVEETSELDLLRCKIELRAAKPDDQAAWPRSAGASIAICCNHVLRR